MGWAVAYDSHWKRDIGYGVPAWCDYPSCHKSIDRGLGYVCGGEPYGGRRGCGLYFCDKHLSGFVCERCEKDRKPFRPKPDQRRWIRHKLRDESWAEWRETYPREVARLRRLIRLRVALKESQ